MSDCIFCKIIDKQITNTVVAETDNVIVIKDINPKASVHNLIIPKKHVTDISALGAQDKSLAGEIVLVAKELAKDLPGSQDFRLIANNGAGAGQCVFHLHFHFLAGKKLPGF